MLLLDIKGRDLFNEELNEFIEVPGMTLKLEHSLISISKWESKWHKPFISKDTKTREELIDYITCMSINGERIDNKQIDLLITDKEIKKINEYIDDSMTATWFSEDKKKPASKKSNSSAITSELIYYWMIAQNIPFECQKWHINRLMTLIKICSIKNEEQYGKSKSKMSKSDILRNNSALNAKRRAMLHTKG